MGKPRRFQPSDDLDGQPRDTLVWLFTKYDIILACKIGEHYKS